MLRHAVLRVVLVLIAGFGIPSLSIACEQDKEKVVNTVAPAAPVAENTTIQKDVTVFEFVLANEIEGREPKDIVENFRQSNGRAYAFARLSAIKNSEITFVWLREDKAQARFTTTVHASKKWRTFSSVKLRPGHWKVQLLLGQEVLAEKAFIVE